MIFNKIKMETSNQQQNKKLSYSNSITSAIRKKPFGTDLLNFWESYSENTEEFYSSAPEHLYEDRFQVDRTKLRKMMQSSIKKKTEADIYFENIMKSTETQIEWPRSYKNDTKCKQHPYVRICGNRLEDVTWAKGMVLASLEINNSFLKLKMAISNADHLFIIGRNNYNVNRIMDETETHIQFPDSNQMKKENQVVVFGSLEGLENARVQLRLSSPLLMSFELPMNQTISFVDKIRAYFKVQVVFAASSKPDTSLVLIHGSARRAENIKGATRSLLNSAFGKFASNTIVSVQLQIPPHHQESVKGENCTNILAIMQRTNTKIFFPELATRGYRKSQVIITGTIDEVCTAREELVDNFPIELTFDVLDENGSATEIMDLGKKAGLSITISQKERECGVSVTVKGPERLMERIYEIHHTILKLKPIFRYKKCLPMPYNFCKDAYQQEVDQVFKNNIQNLLTLSHLSLDDRLNETSISNEQFPAMSSPDSGHASEASFQSRLQQNQWTTFGSRYHNIYSELSESTGIQPTYSRNFASQHSSKLIQSHVQRTSHGECIPIFKDFLTNSFKEDNLDTVDYTQDQPLSTYPSDLNRETNNWIVSGHQDIRAVSHCNSPTNQQKKLVNITVPEEISPTYYDKRYSGSNYVSDIESDASSQLSFSLLNSPLIVGSEESVAERLICSGWGSFF